MPDARASRAHRSLNNSVGTANIVGTTSERCAFPNRKVVMKLDLSKLVRVAPYKPKPPTGERFMDVEVVDKFEADAERRLQQLDDWQDAQPDESGFAFVANPKELDNDLYNTIHNYDADYTDTQVGSITSKTIYETICPTNFIVVPRDMECVCGDFHK